MNTEVMFSSKDNTWETPQWLFNALNKRFQFTLDVCALPETAKCEKYFTPRMDGLRQSWVGERCWMNPPYGKGKGHNIMDWVRKARESAQEGALVVGLLPVRPDTAWWQCHVLGHADVRYIRGRLKFGDSSNSAPFASAIALWWGWPSNYGHFAE